jgi:hypothetical protein
MPAIAAKTWLIGDLFKAYTGSQLSRVLARLTLRGNFLWAKENGEDDSKLYLDGEVFRNKKNQDFRINLPSGDGRKGGDFEMWFWLKTRPPLELEMNISNSPIEQGGSTNITVKMKNRKAPLGGATIKLYIESIVYATNNVHIDMPYDSLIIIPETLAINDGLEEGAFSAKSIPPDYGPQVNVEIKATYGGAEATKIFQVLGRIG